MSFRGGRGGFGGRGGLKGATWEQDEGLEVEARKIREKKGVKIGLFPDHPTGANVKKPNPLTAKEKRQVRHLKTLQEQIHRGPLYTQPTKRNVDNPIKIFGEEQFNAQYGTDRKANMDPFTEGVETYSDRYLPTKNLVPKLSGRPFNKEFFPEELWSTLDGEDESLKRNINKAIGRKSLILGSMNGRKAKDPAVKRAEMLAKIDAMTRGDDDLEDQDDEEQEEEPLDDDYDDDELGDDYNAEKYFEDGDENDDDVGGGGEDDY